jgi:hypothetical protein
MYGYFWFGVNVWWEWFSTTILDGRPTESIAVGYRSYNILKLFSSSKKVSLSIRLAAPRPVATLTPDT